MTQFKAMKFRVKNEEHSKQIQEKLFEMGYEWGSCGAYVSYTYSHDLFTSSAGNISYANSEMWFAKQKEHQEYTLEQLIEETNMMTSSPQKPLTAEELGWKAGDEFEVIVGGSFNVGEVVTLITNLDSRVPKFENGCGKKAFESVVFVRPLKQKPDTHLSVTEMTQPEYSSSHYNSFYTLTEKDIKAGKIKLDPYFVSKQWQLGKKDDSGILFHSLKTIARFGDKNSREREIKALYNQIKSLAELEGVELE